MADETNNSGAAAASETATTATDTGAGQTAPTETQNESAGQAQEQQTQAASPWVVPQEFIKDGKILGKFDPNNPAEVLKAYQNLEKQFHQQAQQPKRKSPTELADTFAVAAKGEQTQPVQKAQAQQMAAEMAQQAQAAQEQGGQAAEDAYWAQFGMTTQQGRGVATLAQHLAQQQINQVFTSQLQPLVGITNRLVLENAIQGLQNKYGDFDQHDQEISAYLSSDPEMSALVKANPAKWLEKTYLMVRNVGTDRKTREVAAAATVAATSAEQQRQQTKAAAAVEQPGTRSAPTPQSDPADSWLESASHHLNKGRRLKL